METLKNKKILVTGTLGQDGSNMCDYLLRMPEHKVFGMALYWKALNSIKSRAIQENNRRYYAKIKR